MKKQQKILYALYIERESKKGNFMEENVEQISINVEKVNKIKSNFPDEDLKDVPKEITDNMEIIPVSSFNEVYTKLFK